MEPFATGVDLDLGEIRVAGPSESLAEIGGEEERTTVGQIDYDPAGFGIVAGALSARLPFAGLLLGGHGVIVPGKLGFNAGPWISSQRLKNSLRSSMTTSTATRSSALVRPEIPITSMVSDSAILAFLPVERTWT